MTSANSVSHSASSSLDQLQRVATPVLEESKRQAGALLTQSGELVNSVSTRASETFASLGKSLIAYTKQNPLMALMLAAGAGALLVVAAKSAQSFRE